MNGIKTCQSCADPGCKNCQGRGYTFELAPPPDILPRVHDLKCWPGPFQALVDGRKRFEYRKDDRGFRLCDILRLREWGPDTETYTGRVASYVVTYIIHGPKLGIPAGFCVMSVEGEQP